MERQSGQHRDSLKIFIQAKNACRLFQGDGCNDRINGCDPYPLTPGESKNRRGMNIRTAIQRLKHFPFGEKAIDLIDVARESLQHLGNR